MQKRGRTDRYGNKKPVEVHNKHKKIDTKDNKPNQ